MANNRRWKRPFDLAAPLIGSAQVNRNGWGGQIPNGTSASARSRWSAGLASLASESRNPDGPDSSRCLARALAFQAMSTQTRPGSSQDKARHKAGPDTHGPGRGGSGAGPVWSYALHRYGRSPGRAPERTACLGPSFRPRAGCAFAAATPSPGFKRTGRLFSAPAVSTLEETAARSAPALAPSLSPSLSPRIGSPSRNKAGSLSIILTRGPSESRLSRPASAPPVEGLPARPVRPARPGPGRWKGAADRRTRITG